MTIAKKLAIPKIFARDVRRAVKILRAAGCSEIFLFGSIARGRVRVSSDLDIAVHGLPPKQFFRVLGKLLMELDHSVDLIDLDTPDPFVEFLQKRGALVQIA